MPVFGKIFFFQVILAVIVICVLKVVLNRNLIEFALRELDALRRVDVDEIPKPVHLQVASYKELPLQFKQKLQKITQRQFGADVKISLEQDRSLWGGVVIRYANHTINYGLKNRLKESGFIK